MKCDEVIKEISERYRVGLSWETIAYAKGFFWFAADCYNAFFRVNATELLDTCGDAEVNAQFVGTFPNEVEEERLWADIEVCGDYLVFVPLIARNFTVYDMRNAVFRSVEIKEQGVLDYKTVDYNERAKFVFCKQVEDKAVFFSYTYSALVVLEPETMKIEYIEEPIRAIESLVGKHGPYFGGKSAIINVGEEIRVWSPAIKSFMCVNKYTYQTRVEKTKIPQKPYLDVVYDGEYYWMMSVDKTDPILRVDYDGNQVKEFYLPEGVEKGCYAYADAVFAQNKILLFPKVCNSGLIIDVGKENVCTFDLPADCLSKSIENQEWNFRYAKLHEHVVIAFSAKKTQTLLVDVITGEIRKRFIRIRVYEENKKEEMGMFCMQMEKRWNTKVFYESEVFSLFCFLENVI